MPPTCCPSSILRAPTKRPTESLFALFITVRTTTALSALMTNTASFSAKHRSLRLRKLDTTGAPKHSVDRCGRPWHCPQIRVSARIPYTSRKQTKRAVGQLESRCEGTDTLRDG